MEKSLAEKNRIQSVLSNLSFNYKTKRTLELMDELKTRQMAMTIFVYLDNPVRY